MNEASARGALLGFALGDALGAVKGTPPPAEPLTATAASQLLCATADGMIRASIRGAHKVCHPPSVVAHATLRWAAGQGISTPGAETWKEGAEVWPDGWLTQVPAYRERRGSAPATVAALRHGPLFGSPRHVPTSRGAHAIARTLPVGLYGDAEPIAREIAQFAHAGDAVNAAVLSALLIEPLATEELVIDALIRAREAMPLKTEVADRLRTALKQPVTPDVLRVVAPDAKATSTLVGGFSIAAHCADADGVRAALRLACGAPYATGVAAVAGAYLGARFGADALPVEWVSRLELAWTVDTLARDTVREIAERPAGTGWDDETDPNWFRRYPGW